jgi:MFS family permease
MGALGRVASGFVGDRYLGGQNTLILIVALTSLLLFCWVEVTTQAGLYAWAVLYGIVGATIQTLFPATLSSLTPDLRMAGTRMGMVFTILSFAVLIGPPAAGQLIQMNGGGYEYAQLFAGGVMFVGCCFLIAARYSTKKKFFLRI